MTQYSQQTSGGIPIKFRHQKHPLPTQNNHIQANQTQGIHTQENTLESPDEILVVPMDMFSNNPHLYDQHTSTTKPSIEYMTYEESPSQTTVKYHYQGYEPIDSGLFERMFETTYKVSTKTPKTHTSRTNSKTAKSTHVSKRMKKNKQSRTITKAKKSK
jgi:hypothetical protein